MLDHAEIGTLTRQEMHWSLFPPVPSLANTWANSWNTSATQTAVKRAQKLFANDPDMQSHFSRLLNGQLKRDSEEAGKRMKNPEATPETGSVCKLLTNYTFQASSWKRKRASRIMLQDSSFSIKGSCHAKSAFNFPVPCIM
jgi:hypothetical protein